MNTEILGVIGKNGKTDPLKTVESDPLKTVQTDHSKTV